MMRMTKLVLMRMMMKVVRMSVAMIRVMMILKVVLSKHHNGYHPSFEDIIARVFTRVDCSIAHLV